MALRDAYEYLTGPFAEIEGWCVPHLWQTLQPLVMVIEEGGVAGPVAEIGVYHGKFLLGLVKTMGGRGHFAIDVFDLQQFNLDGAGNGNRDKLIENMARAGVPQSSVNIVQADSMTLDRPFIDEINTITGGFSLFSVDGCHRPEHTINDLEIAMQTTRTSGLIFIDDYYNPHWPGVQEGISRYYFTHYPRFVPLAYTCNKLILCHISLHAQYLQMIENFIPGRFPETSVKRVPRFGYDTLTVMPQLAEPVYLDTALF